MTSIAEPRTVIGIDASRAVTAVSTGTEAYARQLIGQLVPRLVPGYTVRLYFREAPDPNDETFAAAVTAARARVIPFPRLWTHARLSWEMARYRPDLLFVPSHVLPLLRPRRTLVTVHDLGYRVFPEAHPAQQRLYLELSTRWNVSVASHVLADSAATRDDIVRAYGTSPEKITVVYPGYSPDLAPVRDPEVLAAVRRRYKIPSTYAYVLFIGRIQPRKNLMRLIEAFDQVARHQPNLALILAGPKGWLADPIEARVRALGLEDRVRFPGYIAAEDKSALISGAEVFAYPSLHEGFGFPALEAQACGTPLLTSTTSSLPEVAGEGAYLVDPHSMDAIATGLTRLLSDVDLRHHLIERGYENLNRFSWPTAAERVREIIVGLLA